MVGEGCGVGDDGLVGLIVGVAPGLVGVGASVAAGVEASLGVAGSGVTVGALDSGGVGKAAVEPVGDALA